MRCKSKEPYITNATRWRMGLLAALMWLTLMAPGLSRWLAAAEGMTWVEVCSAQGMRWVQVSHDGRPDRDGSTAPEEDTPNALLEACAYCTLTSDRPWLDTSLVAWVLPRRSIVPLSNFGERTPPKVFALAPTARGPPPRL
ncbi:MAG: hypothetical protein RLZZ612_1599 [Pseudomonadota bacterium]